MSQETREIPGYEGVYSATSDGQIISHPKERGAFPGQQIVKAQRKSYCGYMRVSLAQPSGGPKKTVLVHRLVCSAFHGQAPFGRPIVNHIDGNKANNRPDNLEWVSPRENNIHAFKIGLAVPLRGSKSGSSILVEDDIPTIRYLCSRGASAPAIAKCFGVTTSTINLVLAGKSWKHVA